MGFYASKLFPLILDTQLDQEKYRKERIKTLQDVDGHVLEIGFGTGLNLPHYPSELEKIVALDIIPIKNSKLDSRIQESGIEVDFQLASSELMPFKSNSFDCVVSTWTLCSIHDLDSAFSEIHRVLKPTGRFVFLEHGLAERQSIQKIQRFFTPVQKVLACGCHLDREIDMLVKNAGFKIHHMKKYRLGGIMTTLADTMYRGVALPI